MTTHQTFENLEIQHSAATRILHIEKRPQDIVAVVLKAKYTRVLAAAPQLLKALKLVVEASDAPNYGNYSDSEDRVFEAIEKAKPIIAQAEGQKE